MNFKICLLLSIALLVSACGGSGPASQTSAGSVVATLPATVEGDVIFDVIEGDDEFGDYGNWNFGTLTVESEEILVEADGPVLKNLKLPEEGGRVRATISSVKQEAGDSLYKTTSIQSL